MIVIDRALVDAIKWEDNPQTYDERLFKLGEGHDHFIVLNPRYDVRLLSLINLVGINMTDDACVMLMSEGHWILKKFSKEWLKHKKYTIVKNPNFMQELETILSGTSEYNPALPRHIFSIPDYKIELYDLEYEHVWYVDPKYQTGENKVWIKKLKAYAEPIGLKDMGYVTPIIDIEVEYNPSLPKVFVDEPFTPSAFNFQFEHVWYLDNRYWATDEKIWVKKLRAAKPILGTKEVGIISPIINVDVKFNTDIPAKFMDDAYIPKLSDLGYEHVWYLPLEYQVDNNKIWAKKLVASSVITGEKDMGYISPNISKKLDIVFIGYNQKNVEENWNRVLKVSPRAKRIDGVTGIFEAHKKAAQLATTDMFYVVDGDAYIVDGWDFNFSPPLFDRDCIHIFTSINPINGLTYGYGGVKIFPRQLLLDMESWGIDMTTTISKKLRVMDTVSNISAFDTDEYSTWRSAFRECAKLVAHISNSQDDDTDTQNRLTTWMTAGSHKFGKYAISGAKAGYKYGKRNASNMRLMKKINDNKWLEEKFKNDNI